MLLLLVRGPESRKAYDGSVLLRTIQFVNTTLTDALVLIADWLPVAFGALFGAMFASFYCVVYERVPKNLTLLGRSFCFCGRQLSSLENVPVLGWVFTLGRARCCGSKIPFGYLIAELAGAVLGGVAAYMGDVFGVAVLVIVSGIATYIIAKRRASCYPADTDESNIERRTS